MKKIFLTIVAIFMMGMAWGQAARSVSRIGGVVTKIPEGIRNLQEIQRQLRFQVESQYRAPILIPTLPKINSSKIPAIDTTKFRLHRITLQKTETQRSHDMFFEERYQLNFPMDTSITSVKKYSTRKNLYFYQQH